jgi:protein-L-isoaspartate(D-aspartate) O-methyltransferase
MSRAASPQDLVAAARAAGIADARVLAAISATPRAGFVPADYVAAAYRDEPIPIGHRQVTTQPSLSARMIEGLHLQRGDHVLEIGTGLGFQTALLARLAARVISIERWPVSCSRELCGVRVIPAVDVAVVQVKAARRCDGWAGWPVRLWVYGGSTRRVPGRRGPVGDRAV